MPVKARNDACCWRHQCVPLLATFSAKPNFTALGRERDTIGSTSLLLIFCLSLWALPARAQELTVFAAASLTDAMTDMSVKWASAGHPPLRLSFGSSSTLAHQIELGASANLFASADTKWMDYLAHHSLIVPETRKVLLGNDLILIVPKENAKHIIIKPGFDLLALLGPNGRLAVGNPAHVPVGLYARQALTTLGLWDQVAPRLAQAENVRSAVAMVEHGEAPAGIVYETDAAASNAVAIAGIFPTDTHYPISYPFAVVKTGDIPQARALVIYLGSPEVLAIFAGHGFKTE
jgi:molybdate transport system substrate-binding protein